MLETAQTVAAKNQDNGKAKWTSAQPANAYYLT